MWRELVHFDVVVAGLAQRTQESCLRAARMLSRHENRVDPSQLTEQPAKDDRGQHTVRKPPTPCTSAPSRETLRFPRVAPKDSFGAAKP